MNKLVKKKKKGFTLIELIAVIAILAVLAVIAVPRVISYVDKSKKVAIQTTATTIYNAAEAAYNDGRLKTATDGSVGNNATLLVTNGNFDAVTVSNAISSLEAQNLLSNLPSDAVTKLGPATTLGNLRVLMNTDPSTFSLNGENLSGSITAGKYEPASTSAK
ncbi:type IV pilin protein [Clostridium sardiniense]|uniref:type IV pilin protein n=1 Tax=Clostridium sardiniense TaxID=29369 RepID=UPI001FD508BA|nr:type II secretion system protein [Clostridium sardiniense]MDQ0461282.1 type IV pilus assembly protein PilA [Clostridium sardiniense]